MASADTRLAIASKRTTFVPPLGWKYARGSDRSSAVHPQGSAIMVLSSTAAKDDAAIQSAIEHEAAALPVDDFSLSDFKRRFTKPDGNVTWTEGTVDLWEVDAKRQRGKPPKLREHGNGTLLVAVARSDHAEPIIALGFVLDSIKDTDAPSLIMQAVGTLQGAP